EHVGKALGQSIVIENRPGGGGNLGAEAIAKATPDGYTIGLIQLGNVAINPHIYADMTFDPLNDLMPVAPVTTSPILVVANAKVAANDLRELIALAKRSPGKLSYGSGGPGTAPHLAGEMFKALAAIDILHVPRQRPYSAHVCRPRGGARSSRSRPRQGLGSGAVTTAQGGSSAADVGRGRSAGV